MSTRQATAFHPTLIPNLREQAEAAYDNKPFEAYTEKTQQEFHNLLCEILHDYETSMKQLAKYHDPKETADLKDYKYCLYKATIYGYILLHLARSSAIERHLQAIESLLTDFRCDETDDTRMMVEQNENDDDLRSVQPSAVHNGGVIPLWQSYLRWLQLIVSHFDAVSIVTQYINRPEFRHNHIAIKILIPPRVCTELVTWKQLLESKYFPQSQLMDMSTDAIVAFLQKWSDSDKEAKGEDRSIDQILEIIRAPFDPLTHIRLTERLKAMGNIGSSGWKEYVKNIVELLEKSIRSSTVQEAIPDIIQTLVTLRANSLLFKMLRKAPLSSGTNFPGVIHCGALLASLIDLARTETSGPTYDRHQHVLDELQNAEMIIGVSKRLCPLCAMLFEVLGFVVRGSHSTISPCALPTWTKKDAVDRVNRALGSQLRRELVEIMECTYLAGERASSMAGLEQTSDGMDVDTI